MRDGKGVGSEGRADTTAVARPRAGYALVFALERGLSRAENATVLGNRELGDGVAVPRRVWALEFD